MVSTIKCWDKIAAIAVFRNLAGVRKILIILNILLQINV